MDQLTHISIDNCLKELEALDKLVANEYLSYSEISDFLKEISWQLENVVKGVKYTSDELQCVLSKYEG